MLMNSKTMALSRARVCVTSFPAIMVLLWNYLMFIQFYLILYARIFEVFDSLPSFARLIPVIFTISCTFIGLLSDVCIGRYRAIMICVILSFISWIIIGISLILNNCYVMELHMKQLLWNYI